MQERDWDFWELGRVIPKKLFEKAKKQTCFISKFDTSRITIFVKRSPRGHRDSRSKRNALMQETDELIRIEKRIIQLVSIFHFELLHTPPGKNGSALSTTSFANMTGQNWVSMSVLESLLRATQNYGDASKRHLMESSRLPFALFDDYLQYMLLNGFVQVKETPYENLYCLTQKGSEALRRLGSDRSLTSS